MTVVSGWRFWLVDGGASRWQVPIHSVANIFYAQQALTPPILSKVNASYATLVYDFTPHLSKHRLHLSKISIRANNI